MAVKIRLARHGKKKSPFYHIVVADGRAPRDGRFIEKIGTYNPITNPATIVLNFDKALDWLHKGAQPTETARAILSYEGVLMKKHLLDGVKKGAFDEATAEAKFKTWKDEQYARISDKKSNISKDKEKKSLAQLEAEAKIKDARAEAIAKKRAASLKTEEEETTEVVAAEETQVEAEQVNEVVEAVVETPVAEAVVETPVAETPAENTSETPAEETENKE